MKIKLTSIFVADQERAVKFYTEVLGFVKKADLIRWLHETAEMPAGRYWDLQLVQNYQALGLQPSQDDALAELRSAVTWLHADELDRQAQQAAAAGDVARVRALLQQKTALDILPPAQQD